MSEILRAFGLDTAARLSGLSRAQLLAWDRTGFYRPQLAHADRRERHSRVYSFSDLLALKTLAKLKTDFGISTQHLKKAKRWLALLDDQEWADRVLYVDKVRKRVATPDDSGQVRDAEDGQALFAFALGPVRSELISDIEAGTTRDATQVGRFSKQRGYVGNQTTFAGTRVPVDSVLSFIEDGFTDEQILRNYPSLSSEELSDLREESDAA